MSSAEHRIIGGGERDLVLLHGWGQSLANMEPLAQLVCKYAGVRAHLLNLPGFGGTPEPPAGGWSVEDYSRWVLGYMDAQGLQRVVLLGHSNGGRVAIKLARLHPERIVALVLIASAGLPSRLSPRRKLGRAWTRLLRRLARLAPGSLRQRLLDAHTARYASADYRAASLVMRATLVRAVSEDLSAVAAAIAAPTLLLWGERDTETPLDQGERLRALIPGSRLVVLPGVGHFPHSESSGSCELCAYQVAEFLS